MAWNLESARYAFAEGRIQSWIEAYLQELEWENLGLLSRVQKYGKQWLEPQLLPLESLFRVSGPGPEFLWPKDPDRWQESIDRMIMGKPSREEFPPLIAWRELDGVINLADGNHRADALSALGYSEAWVLVHESPLRSEEEIEKRRLRLLG